MAPTITGVVISLNHKFRGMELGRYGNTNLGASNDMGEWEAWIKAGTGDDKTEIGDCRFLAARKRHLQSDRIIG
jgi:hypothetical protein